MFLFVDARVSPHGGAAVQRVSTPRATLLSARDVRE